MQKKNRNKFIKNEEINIHQQVRRNKKTSNKKKQQTEKEITTFLKKWQKMGLTNDHLFLSTIEEFYYKFKYKVL